jgi:membrane protein YdbS with pleckstrin-like domain
MALMECPECKKQISTSAKTCPSCGYVLPVAVDRADATPLLTVRPSWWSCFWLLLFCWLIIPLLLALRRRYSLLLSVYPNRVSLERGWLSKETRELFIKDIRSIDVEQSILQRMLGIGNVTLSSAAAVDAAEVIAGVPGPKQIKDLLIQLREQVESH